jgi:hypothetical protein
MRLTRYHHTTRHVNVNSLVTRKLAHLAVRARLSGGELRKGESEDGGGGAHVDDQGFVEEVWHGS